MKPLNGNWKIIETELWGQDFVDLIEPGRVSFEGHEDGRIIFGAVNIELDCRYKTVHKRPFVEFTFQGVNDVDPVCGRGHAVLKSDTMMEGQLYFHYGDESWFIARKMD